MTQYLVSRSEGAPPASVPVDLLAGQMFFQMWRVRSDPYNVLSEGDTLWWVDQNSREVRWELRVANLRRTPYHSTIEAMDWLRRWYGILPSDLTSYQDHKDGDGYLIAWEHDIVGPVTNVALPDGYRLGRNGFRRISDNEARSIGLPAPGRRARFRCDPLPEEPGVLAEPRTRYIPIATKRQVWERDGERCRMCQTTKGPFHIDHIFPWSRGGSNDLDNLQVLCAICNLRKSAQPSGDEPPVPAIPELLEAAHTCHMEIPHTIAELAKVLEACATTGQGTVALRLAWALDDHPDISAEILAAVQSALAPLRDEQAVEAELFAVASATDPDVRELQRLACHPAAHISRRAMVTLAEHVNDPAERIRLARQARSSDDTDQRLQARAAYLIGFSTDDDQEWVNELGFAMANGDPDTASAAHLCFGSQVGDLYAAYEHLEAAFRSPSLETAADAARRLAERLGDDLELARAWQQAADEIDVQLAEVD